MESPKNWSITIRVDETDPRKPIINVEMKNTSATRRLRVIKGQMISYDFVWKEERPAVRRGEEIQDRFSAEFRSSRVFDYIPSGAVAPEKIDLSTCFDLKPGKRYTLRLRRFLDEAGHKKAGDRASVTSNEVSFQIPP